MSYSENLLSRFDRLIKLAQRSAEPCDVPHLQADIAAITRFICMNSDYNDGGQ